MMKKMRLFSSFVMLGVMALAVSCDDDESIDGGGSVPVADGYYVAQVGVTPTSANELKAEKVEGEAFANLTREGFLANYMYLAAGSYNVVNVIDQEISQTLGGTSATSEVGSGSECDLKSYTVVEEFAVDGAAISISTAGLYKVAIDITTKEILFVNVSKAHVIGGATSFDWSQNVAGELPLIGAATADGVTFKGTNILMEKGEWKVRFNCGWTIDRRIDNTQPKDNANGYVMHTNFGGTLTALEAGGANLVIPFGSDGKYTIEVKWTPTAGIAITTTNTEPIAPKAVNSYDWGIIGSATPIVDWSADTNLPLLAGSTATAATYEIASLALTAGGEFKIRANDSWGIVLKPGTGILGTVTGDSNFESTGGDDPNWKVKVGGGGNYKITVATTNGGEKWTLTFVKL